MTSKKIKNLYHPFVVEEQTRYFNVKKTTTISVQGCKENTDPIGNTRYSLKLKPSKNPISTETFS